LLGPSPVLIVVSICTPRLHFFPGKCCAYRFRKKKGAVEYSFWKIDTLSIPKYLHPLTCRRGPASRSYNCSYTAPSSEAN
jgi:hypothetical protein